MSDSKYKINDDAYLEWLFPKDIITNRDELINNNHYRLRPDYESYCEGYQAAIVKAEQQLVKALEQYSAGELTPAATDAIALWNEKTRSAKTKPPADPESGGLSW